MGPNQHRSYPSPLSRSFLRARGATRTSTPWVQWVTQDLPPDVLADAVRRLRILSLLFAGMFFMLAVFPALVSPEARAFLQARMLPAIGSIALGLGVFAITVTRRVPTRAVLAVALLFEVGASYGIAFTEYRDFASGLTTPDGDLAGFGLSWVSVWVPLFAVAVPTPPRRTAIAAALAVTAVPVAVLAARASGSVTVAMAPQEFFFFLVFPYALVVAVAFVGSRVVFRLGRAVQEAQEMGSYRLAERLGAGGMGEVWRAEHRMLARPAAIKLIRPDALAGAGEDARRRALARFEREAQATAAMRCPHTVELYDFGVTEDGAFYYVMELLDGLDLERLVLDFGAQPAGRVVHILGQMCRSLAEAHEHGLIHRDVKPANVYLCRLGRDVDWVKVLDFGLVKSQDEPELSHLKLTADNTIGGTPAFMAPEQVTGEQAVDGRTDLYALGCVAYWLLTGRLVFEGRTAVDTMIQHVEATPVPPSRCTETAVPDTLDAVVLRCLAKSPADRPASAEALAAMLRDVTVAEPWGSERARAWWELHRPAGRAAS